MLQMINLGFGGGEKTREVYDDMLNEYYMLEGIDRKREEIEANWEDMKIRKRG